MFKNYAKQIFIALAAVFALPLCGNAQNAVKVTPENGEPTVFLLKEHPKMTLGESSLNITTDEDKAGISFDANKYHSLEFATVEPNSVGSLITGEASVSMTDEAILLNNFKPGDKVVITNLNGMIVKKFIIGFTGDAEISTTDMPNGIYIFNSNQVKFKFNKK